MMDSRRPRRTLLPVLAAVFVAACDQPPTREIAAAEVALAQARQDGAERYASERFREAETALRDARRKVQERDYRGALSSATDAVDRSRNASQAATAAKTVARSATEVAQAEVQAALDEVATIREEATAAKVPEKAFEDLEPDVKTGQDALQAITRTLEAGNLLEAQKAAIELKARMASLPGRFREALDAWQAAQPKGRGRAPAPPPVKKK